MSFWNFKFGTKTTELPCFDFKMTQSDMSKADAGRAVDATLSAIGGSLSGGDSVSLVGFGTFSVRHRAARMGRNPQTGAAIHINASKSVGFKAGKALKASL